MKIEWQSIARRLPEIARRMQERLQERLQEEDKQQHFLYSLGILLLSYCLFSLMFSLVITLLIGLGKEIWDHYYGSGFCCWDMLANVLGILAGLLLIAGFNLAL